MGRLTYLDNLKFFLTLIVVMHHIAIVISGNGGMPFYLLNYPHSFFSNYFFISFTTFNQAFFMSLFFFISAYFIPNSLEKHGIHRFIKARLIRLGIPLVIYYFILSPGLGFLIHIWQNKPFVWKFNLGPLWFVEVLLIFSLGYGALWQINKKSILKTTPTMVKLVVLSAGIGLATFFVRIIYPMNTMLFSINIAELPIYLACFSAGIIAANNSWLSRITKKSFIISLVLTLISLLTLLIIVYLALNNKMPTKQFLGGFNYYSLFWCLWEVLCCLGTSISLIFIFNKIFSKTNRFFMALTVSSYAVYLLQFYFIFFVMIMLEHITWNGVLVWALASLITNAIGFLIANYLRQLPLLNRVL